MEWTVYAQIYTPVTSSNLGQFHFCRVSQSALNLIATSRFWTYFFFSCTILTSLWTRDPCFLLCRHTDTTQTHTRRQNYDWVWCANDKIDDSSDEYCWLNIDRVLTWRRDWRAHRDPSERNGIYIYTQSAHAWSSYGSSRHLWRTLQSVREILRKWPPIRIEIAAHSLLKRRWPKPCRWRYSRTNRITMCEIMWNYKKMWSASEKRFECLAESRTHCASLRIIWLDWAINSIDLSRFRRIHDVIEQKTE